MTMKETFYWLKEQTKTRKKYANERYEDMMRINAITIAEYERGKTEAYDCVLAMIDEAEAKWEYDCCIRVVGKPFTSSCGKKYNKWTDLLNEPYCSKCGKPIKIVEVE